MPYKRNPFGWSYPPGCEFHPDAPWNQEEVELDENGEIVEEEYSKEDYLADQADNIRKYGKDA
jgi:hypothetical protein